MSQSRILNAAEASRRHGALAGTYAAAILHADPLADAAVEALHPFHGRWWPMVLKALEEGIAAVPDAPPELAALIASLPPEPKPEEWEKMARGSAAVGRAGDSAGLVLQCASLMIDYWSPPAMKPLVMTGTLQQQTIHRLTQTNAWWIELHRPGGLHSQQDGYKTTVHVRLIHAFVRRMIRGSAAWNRAAWGEPINQADLFFQVVGFSKLMVDSLQRMGYRFTAEEKEGYFLFWRHTAALLGVEKALLPSVNETDCGRYWDLWMLTNPGPDADGIALAGTTLETVAGVGSPSAAMRGFQLWLLRGATYWLLGHDVSQKLRVPWTAASFLLPLVYKPAVWVSEAFTKWRGVDHGQAAARAIRKLALGNAALGVVPEGTHVVSAPERLEALAKYKPGAPAS
ncbi:MAG: oxygenase MpaB family protein [Alphaproteobacteria bacterium]